MVFNFTFPSPLTFVITMGWIGLFMFIGVIVRAKVPLFRKYLIPTCIIGGVLGMFANWIFLSKLGPLGVDHSMVGAVTYHIFPLFFSALAFRSSESKTAGRRFLAGGLWLAACFIGIPFFLYAVACLLTMGVNTVCGTEYLTSFGIIPTHGFTSGPGAAMPIGLAWDNHLKNGLDLASLGLTGGSLGFLVAYIIGIPMANYYHKRSKLLGTGGVSITLAEQRGFYDDDDDYIHIGRETTHNSNIETLAIHIGLIFFNYALALAICLGIAQAVSYTPYKNYIGMIWTLVWMAPLITAWPIKKIMKISGFEFIVCPDIMRHISNFFIDLMAITAFFGMTLKALLYFLPLLCAIVVFIPLVLYACTQIIVRYINDYKDVRTLYLMGTLTGTAATGLFLCRIIDPESRSPIAFEQAIAPVFMTIPLTIATTIMHFEVLGGHSPWSVIGWSLVVAGLCGICLIFFIRALNRVYRDDPDTMAG